MEITSSRLASGTHISEIVNFVIMTSSLFITQQSLITTDISINTFDNGNLIHGCRKNNQNIVESIKMWNPVGRLSPREWELSGPIVDVAPEVAVDDKWAVPRGLLACPLLLRALYRHQHRNLTSVRPVRPTIVMEEWMGQVEWPTQSELEPHLLVAAWKPQKARHTRNATPSSTNDLEWP